MASLEFAGDNGSLSDINATQGEFRSQIAALTDMVKQIAGNAAVSAGDSAQADPLNAPFTLYVNPYTGSDEFVGGSYNDYETGTLESKIKRLEKQRLVCGFSPQRPFKTINRAVIEAAIITSKDWLNVADPSGILNTVSIVLSPGVHTLYNDPGQASTSIASWGVSKNPTTADLIKFNPATVGGVLLPRGCSLCGPDLRKTTIRPNWVPAVADEAADYSNRHGMLKMTGTGYFFGHTFMDKIGLDASHHLLDAYQFASKAELDDFYAKTFSAVGSGADLASALTVTRGTEYQIVGPINQTETPTAAWDTTSSASPYIFNVSIRSNYGMGGAFMDGSKVEGLKSMVCANFTGVSLQKDMSCWQIYDGSNWVQPTYEQYIAADPDNTRMNPARLSRHISAINDAFIQEVSVFAIGQGIHHFTDLGGEITVTNSNSSFGGCAAYSKGYKGTAFPSDTNWAVSGIRVPLDLQAKTGNIRTIYLGTIDSATSSKITLTSQLAADASSNSIPAVLLEDGYTLASGTYIWAENPLGEPWYAPLASNAWEASAPNEIDISSAFAGNDATTDAEGTNLLVGKRVYIRRMVDTRTPSERRVSVLANNTASARLPQRNFIIQTDPLRTNGAISREFTTTGTEIFAVSSAGAGNEAGVTTSTEFTLRRSAPSTAYNNGDFYTAGRVVRSGGKHYVATRDVYATTALPDPASWLETYVHTASDYDAEDPITQEARQIIIDTDTDTDPYSTDLGINWSSVWADDEYQGSTDYKGVHAFLVALGLTSNQAHAALVPQTASNRLLDPTSATDFPNAPAGGAATGLGNWAIEFRRPSTLRLYGHAWEWAGFLNYSKAIPAAQKDLGPQNAFTYYFTNEAGGRVVPQGSNENGFNITPRGLEDIETGSTLTVENIGSSSIDIIAQTEFENLSVTDTLTAENLNVTGTISGLPTVGSATTGNDDDDLGFVRLASISDLQSSATATNDPAIDAAPEVVTYKGLNYWKNYNNLVSARTGIQYVYVDPVNGRVASVSELLNEEPNMRMVWNGTEWVRSANQKEGTSQMQAYPPAKSIVNAVEYINAQFSPNETIELRIGPGFYLETGDLRLTCKAQVRAWDFVRDRYLNNDEDDGSKPFMGQAAVNGERGKSWEQDRTYLVNPENHPIFLSRPRMTYRYSPPSGTFQTTPLRFVFEQEASIIGCVWLGPAEVLTNDDIPDSFFEPSNSGVDIAAIRADARLYPENALNYLIKAEISSRSTDNATWEFMFARSCIEGQAALTVKNCAFDAMAPAQQNNGSLRKDGVITVSAKPARLAGIWAIGNVNVSSALIDAPAYRGNTTYQYTGHHEALIAATTDELEGEQATISLGGTREIGGGTNADADYNFTWNNIHLVNNELEYRDDWNPFNPPVTAGYLNEDPTIGTKWKLIGPGYVGFINTVNRLGQFGFFWHENFLQSVNHRQGFAGIFGNISLISGVQMTRGVREIPAGFTGTEWRKSYFLQRAGTTDEAADLGNTPANPGQVGTRLNFYPLNAQVWPIKKGIDVNEAVTVNRNLWL